MTIWMIQMTNWRDLHMRGLGHGYENEILRKKPNILFQQQKTMP